MYSVNLTSGYVEFCCYLLRRVTSSGNLICYRSSRNWQYANFHHASAAFSLHLVIILKSD